MPCAWSPRSSPSPREQTLPRARGRTGLLPGAFLFLAASLRVLACWLALSALAAAACLPISKAPDKIGADACVTGTVVKVVESEKGGAWFLDFCADYRTCPFTVVVFTRDLKDVGDVRQLQGRTIEIWGRIRSYGGRAEIILRHARQLRGEAARLPPAPKDYDVERRGRYSSTAPNTQQPKRKTGGASKVGTPTNPSDVEKPDPPR